MLCFHMTHRRFRKTHVGNFNVEHEKAKVTGRFAPHVSVLTPHSVGSPLECGLLVELVDLHAGELRVQPACVEGWG